MKSSRKKEIRNVLIRFIESQKLVRDREVMRHSMQRSNTRFNILKPMPIFAVIAIVALLGGGTSFAAQGALPGGILYPVKVGFNEQVVAALQFSSEAKANYEALLAERRLDEASSLAVQGKLDSSESADLESRFAAHAAKVKERINEMEAKGNIRAAADFSSRFETSLKAHDEILIKLQEKDSDVKDIEIKANAALGDILGVRIRLESKIASSTAEENGTDVKTAAEGKVNAATNVISSVRSYLENKKDKLGAQATANAEARLAVADSLVVQAKARIEAGAYGEAFNIGNHAIRVAQDARTLIEAKIELEVDVELPRLQNTDWNDETLRYVDGNDAEIRATSSIQIPGVKLEGGGNASGALKVNVGF